MAKFFGEFMIIFIAKVEKVELFRHLGIKAYGEVEEYLYAVFISAPPGRFALWRKFPRSNSTGNCVGPRSGLKAF